jgi:hypothetical protein
VFARHVWLLLSRFPPWHFGACSDVAPNNHPSAWVPNDGGQASGVPGAGDDKEIDPHNVRLDLDSPQRADGGPGPIDIGRLAESLLFYQKVHLALGRSNVEQLLRELGPATAIDLVKNTGVDAVFLDRDYAVKTSETASPRATHQAASVRLMIKDETGQQQAETRREAVVKLFRAAEPVHQLTLDLRHRLGGNAPSRDFWAKAVLDLPGCISDTIRALPAWTALTTCGKDRNQTHPAVTAIILDELGDDTAAWQRLAASPITATGPTAWLRLGDILDAARSGTDWPQPPTTGKRPKAGGRTRP